MVSDARMLCLITILTLIRFAEPRLHAQTLDIGGIDIQLGQPITSTVSQLRAAYDVNYNEEIKRWLVTKQEGTRTIQLGNIDVSGDRVNLIQKAYRLDGNIDRLSDVYGLALRDAQRLGGNVCQTNIQTLPDGKVIAIVTRCGRYSVTFSLPFELDQGNRRMSAGVSVTVGRE